MTYLTKDDYYRRELAAGRRMAQNAAIETLTHEQHDVISDFCSFRHKFHVEMSRIVFNNGDAFTELIRLNGEFQQLGLPILEGIPTYNDSYINIEDINSLMDYDEEYSDVELDDDEEKKLEWIKKHYDRIYDELSDLHQKMEKHLERIDEKYGTRYAPTGALRVF